MPRLNKKNNKKTKQQTNKLKRKLLPPSRTQTETDGRTGVTIYAPSIILQM